MKLITIDCCMVCPLRVVVYKGAHCCGHAATDGWSIENVHIVQPWCKLKDDAANKELVNDMAELIIQFTEGEIDEDDEKRIADMLHRADLFLGR